MTPAETITPKDHVADIVNVGGVDVWVLKIFWGGRKREQLNGCGDCGRDDHGCNYDYYIRDDRVYVLMHYPLSALRNVMDSFLTDHHWSEL